jgi:hypothetical protein
LIDRLIGKNHPAVDAAECSLDGQAGCGKTLVSV